MRVRARYSESSPFFSPSRLQVQVDTSDHKKAMFDVRSGATVRMIKRELSHQAGVPLPFLFRNGVLIKDDARTLESYKDETVSLVLKTSWYRVQVGAVVGRSAPLRDRNLLPRA